MSCSSVTLRPVHPDDAVALYEVVSHPAVAMTTVRLPSMELAETEEWMRNRTPGRHRLVAQVNGRIAGIVSLSQRQNPRLMHLAALGIAVHPDFWGQGIGTALMEAALDLADNWLNLKRIELDVFTDNRRAVALYEKLGFEIEAERRMAVFGGNGRFHNEYVMARLAPDIPASVALELTHFPRREDVTGLTIRPPRPEDIPDLYEIRIHPGVARTTLQYPSLELPAVRDRMEPSQPGLHRFVAIARHADGSDKVVGNVAMHQYQNPRLAHFATMGMMVHPSYWGMGVGTRLMETITDLADNWINLRRFELEVTTDNPPAIRLYERFGFEHEGTKRLYTFGNGRWADVHVMARLS